MRITTGGYGWSSSMVCDAAERADSEAMEKRAVNSKVRKDE
jgi:hypothetical protein